jgi:hypothetical protein
MVFDMLIPVIILAWLMPDHIQLMYFTKPAITGYETDTFLTTTALWLN